MCEFELAMRRMCNLQGASAQHHSRDCHLALPSPSCQCLCPSVLSEHRSVRIREWVFGSPTERHFSYCLKRGSHSSVVAAPRRNSVFISMNALIGLAKAYFRCTISRNSCRIVYETSATIHVLKEGMTTNSFTSLHSGASDADMLDVLLCEGA